MTLEGLSERLRARLQGRVRESWPLARLTTYRLGGPARVFVEPASSSDLEELARALREAPEVPLLTIGRGSNLVVSDAGWPGVVVRLGSGFSGIEEWSPGGASLGLRAGAATPLPTLANWTARRALGGLEWLIAIPGSVGGAVRMNAGAHSGAVVDRLDSVDLVDLGSGERRVVPAAELDLGYRRSSVAQTDLVIEARFRLERDDPEQIRGRLDEFRRHRAATQPGALQNAGSVFRNPPGDAAGRLVEAAGLKGFAVGGAEVSRLHANFFLATEGATAQDVYDLVHEVRDRVARELDVLLEPEIRFAGPFERTTRSAARAAGE